MSLLIQPKLPVVMPSSLVEGGTIYGDLTINEDLTVNKNLLLPNTTSIVKLGSGEDSIELGHRYLRTNSAATLKIIGKGGTISFHTSLEALKAEITDTLTKWYQNIDMGTNKIVNLADPTNLQDAATKNYVDNTIAAMLKLYDHGETKELIPSAGATRYPATGSFIQAVESIVVYNDTGFGIYIAIDKDADGNLNAEDKYFVPPKGSLTLPRRANNYISVYCGSSNTDSVYITYFWRD